MVSRSVLEVMIKRRIYEGTEVPTIGWSNEAGHRGKRLRHENIDDQGMIVNHRKVEKGRKEKKLHSLFQ